ncbi:Uncharacterised protein [Vibrio cholerae]|nr:Uncharacterised protein [Vibrio cholerae]CSI76318.1 Uncharacterised protein [Vibrio cholerae]
MFQPDSHLERVTSWGSCHEIIDPLTTLHNEPTKVPFGHVISGYLMDDFVSVTVSLLPVNESVVFQPFALDGDSVIFISVF